MIQGICLANITVDCINAVRLRDFYAEFLGWEPRMIESFPVLCSPAGFMLLFNQADFAYVRPVWPEEAGRQQKQMHFDFHVDDIAQAVSGAEKIGAPKAQNQYGGGQYVTMLDPEGHPFCLCGKENSPEECR